MCGRRPSLIHTASARDAAGFRQSVVMAVIVRLWVVSDTLAGGAPMRGMVWSSWRARALRLASCRCRASWAWVCTPVCLGFLLGRCAVWKGVGQEGAWWRVGCGKSPRVAHLYRVVTAAPSAYMVYRSSCRRRVTRTLRGRQLIHLCGVGEVAGDCDLGGVVFARGGVGDDVVGHPFILGGVFRRV